MIANEPAAGMQNISTFFESWYGDLRPSATSAGHQAGDRHAGRAVGLRRPRSARFNRINERYGNVTTTGQIRFGKNIYDPDVSLTQLRKTVGMVFQRPNPLPISIYENVLFGIRSHTRRGQYSRRERDAMVESALRDVQLWDEVKDRLRKKATQLTLEQQQKLCIARLLPLKPRVMLMDEPCSALDAEGIERIELLLQELRKTYTILIVTHNMAQARRASDECAFMLLGRIVEHDKTLNVFLNPREKETEMYVTGRYG